MPLPDTAGGLEWSSLVSAAKAYEGKAGNKVAAVLKPGKKVLTSAAVIQCDLCASAAAQRAVSLFSLTEPQPGAADVRPVTSPVQFHTPQTPRTTPTFSGCDASAGATDERAAGSVISSRSNASPTCLFCCGLQGRGAQRTVFSASPPGGDVTAAQHRFRESEDRWFFPLFCRFFNIFFLRF